MVPRLRGSHRNTDQVQDPAHSESATWLSPQPVPMETGESSQWPSGHSPALWTCSRGTEAPVPGHRPRGAGGTLCGGGSKQLLCPQEAQGQWPQMH